jgi:glycosyltransferase involved in cell wall biosynthesis
MNQFYEVIGVSSDAPILEKLGQKEKIQVKHIEMTRQITPVKDLVSVYYLYKFFKKEKPLIVHTHTPKAGTVGMLAAKLAGVPNRFHTIAGLPLMEAVGMKRNVLNFVEKMTYACATKIYPNSFGLKTIILKEKFCKVDKLKVIGNGSSNGIDTAHFDSSHFSESQNAMLKKELNILPDDFVFVFVGRLVGDKGINELVAAFSALGAAQSKLLLVGPYEHALDPLKPATREAIAQHSDIITTGFQTDVRPYMAIGDALVFPSYREGFPNVVMQAGAMGLPSIVTNINGCNEIITHDFNGIIIPVKDPESLHIAMKLLLGDNTLHQKLKNNSRKHIVDNYEQKVVWEAILAEYKSLENHV